VAKNKKLPRGVKHLGGKRYEVRAYWTDPKTGKPRESLRTIEADSPEEAAFKRRELAGSRVDERAGAAKRLRFVEAIDAWLAKKKISPSTRERYTTEVGHWKSAFADHWLDAVEPDEVTAVIDLWRERGRAPETINGRLRTLRTFARESRMPGMVEAVRAVATTHDEEEENEDEGRGFTLPELRAWLEALDTITFTGRLGSDRTWRPLLRLMAWTGIRFGEATALAWHDLELDAATVRVRRAVWRGVLGKPKARASRREVPLPAEVVEELRAYKRLVQIDEEAIDVSGTVFPSKESATGFLANSGLARHVRRVCKAAKLGPDKKPIDLDGRPSVHVLRHTFNNILRQAAPELVRQAIVGHADAATGKRYSNVGADEKRVALAAVVGMVKPGVKPGPGS
jgi:integrase